MHDSVTGKRVLVRRDADGTLCAPITDWENLDYLDDFLTQKLSIESIGYREFRIQPEGPAEFELLFDAQADPDAIQAAIDSVPDMCD